MRFRLKTMLAGGLVAFLMAGYPSFAGTINQRQWRQQARIWNGYRSGDLTLREFRRLERQQTHIRSSKARARQDGVVTPRERVRIHREQNRASRRIFRQRHDNQYWR